MEKGYRYWSADITPDENPYEAGMGFVVKLKSDGDFIGRQALLKAREDGIQRRLCTLTLDDATCVIYGGEAVYAKDKLVGRVSSGGTVIPLAKILPTHTCRSNWQIKGLRFK